MLRFNYLILSENFLPFAPPLHLERGLGGEVKCPQITFNTKSDE